MNDDKLCHKLYVKLVNIHAKTVSHWTGTYSQEDEQVRQERDKLMLACHGLTPYQGDERECPMTIAGKKQNVSGIHNIGECLLCGKWRPSLLDHLRLWHDKDNNLILSSEPYTVNGGIEGSAIAGFANALHGVGLSFTINADSGYYPGSTCLILIRRLVSETDL